MESLNYMDWLTSILAAIGGINMALIGFFNYDLLAKLFGSSTAYRVVVAAVALGVVYLVLDVWVRVMSYRNQHVHA
ncbi:MAG: DUF378 domain-containing protein [Candidatus Saccharimonadia bacterium]